MNIWKDILKILMCKNLNIIYEFSKKGWKIKI